MRYPLYVPHRVGSNNCQIPLKIVIFRARRGSRDDKTSNESDLLTSRAILNSLFFFSYMIYEWIG